MASAVPAIALAAALCGLCNASLAGPLPGLELQHNGEVSRRLVVPEGSRAVFDARVGAGLALGLKGPLKQQLGAVAPAVSMRLAPSATVSFLAAPGKGAMLVLQTPLR